MRMQLRPGHEYFFIIIRACFSLSRAPRIFAVLTGLLLGGRGVALSESGDRLASSPARDGALLARGGGDPEAVYIYALRSADSFVILIFGMMCACACVAEA